LYLRPALPGSLITEAGDIDNKLKTLFDALKMPNRKQELGTYRLPSDDENPFYVLLEEDKLISRVSVETDILLQLTRFDPNETRLVITVTLSPYDIGWDNIAFVG
jgi:hypothetical protein